MSEYTSLPIWIDAAVTLLRERDYPSGQLPDLLREQVAQHPQRQAGERYDIEVIAQAWRELARVTRDPAIGLTAVQDYFQPASWHTVGLAMLCSSSLRDAIARLGRYESFLTDAGGFYAEEIDGQLNCHMRTSLDHSLLGYEATDFGVAAIIKVLRMIYPGVLRPVQVRLLRGIPADPAVYYSYFGCSVLFNQPELGFSFSCEQVDRPLPAANAELARMQDQLTEDYLAQVKAESLARLVKRRIEALLPSGDLSAATVAQAMHMSSRNLQRRLHDEGTNFKQLLSEVRQGLALRYLGLDHYSMNEVAYLLGFSDQSNFTRAFKRWFDVSPSEKRLQLKAFSIKGDDDHA